MGSPVFEVDPEILSAFFDESEEMLSDLDSLIVELESRPEDVDLINQIFRPFHSLKGNSAFFGLVAVKNLAHELETLLDHARQHRLIIGSDGISLLLRGLDEFKRLLAGARDGAVEETLSEEAEAIVKIAQEMSNGGSDTPAECTPSDVEDVLSWIDNLDESVKASAPQDTIGRLSKFVEVTSGEQCADNSKSSSSSATNEIEELTEILDAPIDVKLDDARTLRVGELLDWMLESAKPTVKDAVKEMRDQYMLFTGTAVGFDDLLQASLKEQLVVIASQFIHIDSAAGSLNENEAESGASAIAGESISKSGSEGSSPAQTVKKKGPANSKSAPARSQTIRVATDSLDEFMRSVGELITVAEGFDLANRRLRGAGIQMDILRDLDTTIRGFRELSEELLENVAAVVRVPLTGVLGRVPRMTRDLATSLSKEVAVEITGEEIMVDRTTVEILEDPFTHLIRNAVDHGLETPEERRASGKSETGTLRIEAREIGGTLEISIKDDGKGIDPQVIREKAVERGFTTESEAQSMSDRESLQLIFQPGFSMAKEVSDVSGRGVGMDVVRSNIQKADGEITIDSTPGEGTTLIVRIPIERAVVVMEGIIVRFGSQFFIVPVEKIKRMLQLEGSNMATVAGRAKMLNTNEKLYPVLRPFGIEASKSQTDDQHLNALIIVESLGNEIALHADEILGQQRFLLKRLSGVYSNLPGVAGAALLGDSSVALVLRPDDLGEMIDRQDVVAA